VVGEGAASPLSNSAPALEIAAICIPRMWGRTEPRHHRMAGSCHADQALYRHG
jgi:hypothetical protein